VYRFGDILGSVGHRVKIHKITPGTGKERGDIEIKDCVVLQKHQEQTDRLPPPHAFRKITGAFYRTAQLTHTRRSDGAPEADGALRSVSRTKIHHYRQLYIDRPEPIVFMPVAVDMSVRIYHDVSRLLFLNAHREGSVLVNELPEESVNFDFFTQLV